MPDDLQTLSQNVSKLRKKANPKFLRTSAFVTAGLLTLTALFLSLWSGEFDVYIVVAIANSLLFIDWAYYTLTWAINLPKYRSAAAFGDYLVSYPTVFILTREADEDYTRVVKLYNNVCKTLLK